MFPAFPQHATATSLLIAGLRLGVIPSIVGVCRQVAGSYGHGGAPYGAHAGRLAKHTFRGLVKAETLVRSHSFVRFHGAFLSREDEATWIQSAITGHVTKSLRPSQAHGPVQSGRSRYCAECAESDLSYFGCAHWLVGHQLPSVHHCWLHGLALFSVCADCGAPFSRADKYRLPTDPCPVCGSREGAAERREFPDAYWPYFDLCSRILEGRAPEVRPAARQSINSALRNATGSNLVEALLGGWGAGTAAELESQLGCKVRIPVIERLLQGGSSGTSNYLTAAIVSFAISELTPDVLSCALRDVETRGKRVQRQKYADPSDDLEGALVVIAKAVGYSVDAARMLSRGLSEGTVRSAGFSSTSVTHRFLDSLESDIRQRIEAARARQAESLKPQGAANRTQAMRKHALATQSAGASGRSSIASSAYKWLKENDRRWFDEHFPRRLPEAADSRTARMRAVAMQEISDGRVSRSAFYKDSSTAYKWLLHHDRNWFEQNFPSYAARRKPATRERHRAVAINLIEGGNGRRKDLVREAPSTCAWLRRNDRAWLDEKFPLQGRLWK